MYGLMNDYHDLQREMCELSEEERELEEIPWAKFKLSYYRRVKTQQEKKQEADEATPEDRDEGDSAISGGPPSVMEGEEEGEEVDLDASMEDLDESDEEQCLASCQIKCAPYSHPFMLPLFNYPSPVEMFYLFLILGALKTAGERTDTEEEDVAGLEGPSNVGCPYTTRDSIPLSGFWHHNGKRRREAMTGAVSSPVLTCTVGYHYVPFLSSNEHVEQPCRLPQRQRHFDKHRA
ncbi:hypothetical protein ARMGADRAFT_1091419 [Armillaria gallica]|uniref:Uncharacterized protein n=1 Tax=Armillaria gallica TaxID=47427 RepID=A0A2H3CS61_ARMGA|nr:hypothetical protein ARMGADRAFT_1091419 [Armillaria gallica]